jgi:DNA gyrase subunit A
LPFAEPSTRAGRRFAKPSEGVEVVGVERVNGGETLIAASKQRRALLCKVDEVNFLSGPGKGVLLLKLEDDDALLAIKVSRGPRDVLTVETSMGGEQRIGPASYELTSRGGRGREIIKRGTLVRVVAETPEAPPSLEGSN